MFTIPAIAPVAYNLGIIVGGIAYALVTGTADPEGFAWGALIGAFIGNFALQAWGARRAGMLLVWSTPWRNPVIWEYVKIAFPLMIGQSIVVLDETYMSVFGDLAGDGAQTQLQYARRTMLVPVGVIAQAAGVAAYPFLARLYAEGRARDMADTVDRSDFSNDPTPGAGLLTPSGLAFSSHGTLYVSSVFTGRIGGQCVTMMKGTKKAQA